MTDKERDDALIAEKKRLAEQLQIFAYGLGSSPSASMMLQAAAILRGDEQPKPDRAEVLFDDLYGKTKDEQIDCFRRHFAELRAEWEAERPAVVVPEEQIKQMVNRFLGWRLPEDFRPDYGISFEPFFNVEWNAKQGKPPQRRTPTGTNLFTSTQAEAMVRYIIDGAKGDE